MNKKRLGVISILSVSLAAISSISATLAWYYNGLYTQVETIHLVMRGEPDLKLSTSNEEESYKVTLEKKDLIDIGTFAPVTSMYSYLWTEQKLTTPKFMAEYGTIEEGVAPFYAGTGYYSQEIYLMANDDCYATLDSKASMFTPDIVKNQSIYENVKNIYPDLSKEQVVEQLNQIVKSLRISILIPDENRYQYVIYNPNKNGETEFAGILDADVDGYYDFDKDTKIEIMYGDYKNPEKIVYDEPKNEDVPVQGTLTCFNSGRRLGIRTINVQASLDAGVEFAKEQSVGPDEIEDIIKIPLQEGVPEKVVVSMYLEGWDRTNTNLVQYSSFFADIKFKIKGEVL